MYKTWAFYIDGSVQCPVNINEHQYTQDQINLVGISSIHKREDELFKSSKYSVNKGKKLNKPEYLTYHPIEITSPILKGYDGLKELMKVWYGCIMKNNLTYLVNSTQGLHIHLSCKGYLDSDKFRKVWMIFEPIIRNIVSKDRQNTQFATPVRLEIYDQYDSVKWIDSSHIEIRLYQGTSLLGEIQYWTIFCLLFVSFVIQLDKDISEIKDKVTFLFKNIINDEKISRYFYNKYLENKSDDFPSIDFDSIKFTNSVLDHNRLKLSRNDWEQISESRSL